MKTALTMALVCVPAMFGCREEVERTPPPPPATEAPPTPPPGARTTTAPTRGERPAATRPEVDVASATTLDLDQVKWGPGPAALPKGAQLAVLEGAPPFPADKTFFLLAKLPKNYTVPPHTHLVTERVTVLKGQLSFGHGEKLDRAAATTVNAGGLVLIPADHVHYAFTTNQETIIAINGVGPWEIIYVDPKNDPRPTPARKPATKFVSQWDADTEAKIIQANAVTFGDPPPGMFPAGVKVAMLESDPNLPKVFTMRLQLPKGFKVPVHAHSVTERFMVVSGSLKWALGDTAKLETAQTWKPGMVAVVPKDAMHYAEAQTEGTVVQITAVGPFDMKYANPADAPKP